MNARLLHFILALFAGTAGAEVPPETPVEGPREAAKREAWTSTVLIISLLEQGDNSAFPGIRAWLEDFHQTAVSTPAPEVGKPFPPVDTDALVTRNPHFWTAYYEVQPADPGLALLHAALLVSGGEAQRALAIATFGLQRSGIPEDIKRGLHSLIGHCQNAQAPSAASVREGTKLYDRRDFSGALAMYERAIAEWPANGTAYAERGLTLRAKAMTEARERSKLQPSALGEDPMNDPPQTTESFAQARRHDPFNLIAYQGDDPAMLTALMALVRSGLPVWEAMRKHPDQLVKHDQLRAFSEACREAVIDDFALVLRQLAVLGQKRYTPDDQQFISVCLRRLAPAAFTGGVLARIGGETRMPARQIVVPAVVEGPEMVLAKTEDAAPEKAKKPDAEPKPKAKGKSSKKKISEPKKRKPGSGGGKSKKGGKSKG